MHSSPLVSQYAQVGVSPEHFFRRPRHCSQATRTTSRLRGRDEDFVGFRGCERCSGPFRVLEDCRRPGAALKVHLTFRLAHLVQGGSPTHFSFRTEERQNKWQSGLGDMHTIWGRRYTYYDSSRMTCAATRLPQKLQRRVEGPEAC